MQKQDPQHTSNDLKKLDFLCWQVSRVKERRRNQQITKILSDRPRLRATDHLN